MAQSLREDLSRAGILPPNDLILVPAPKTADQLGVTRRTLSRWIIDPDLAFPRPVEINGRLYFNQRELDDWKLSRAVRSVKEVA